MTFLFLIKSATYVLRQSRKGCIRTIGWHLTGVFSSNHTWRFYFNQTPEKWKKQQTIALLSNNRENRFLHWLSCNYFKNTCCTYNGHYVYTMVIMYIQWSLCILINCRFICVFSESTMYSMFP